MSMCSCVHVAKGHMAKEKRDEKQTERRRKVCTVCMNIAMFLLLYL